jgi:hypothetical protein
MKKGELSFEFLNPAVSRCPVLASEVPIGILPPSSSLIALPLWTLSERPVRNAQMKSAKNQRMIVMFVLS